MHLLLKNIGRHVFPKVSLKAKRIEGDMLPLKDAASFVELDSFTYSKLGKSSQKIARYHRAPPGNCQGQFPKG